MFERPHFRDLRWPIALLAMGFAPLISLLTSDRPVTAWMWAIALAPLVLGIVWGIAVVRSSDATTSEPPERRSVLVDVLVPILTAVIGSGLLIWWLDRPVVAAEQVRACEEHHGLEQAQSDVRELPLRESDRRMGAYARVSVSSCEWPPPGYADKDGFSSINVVSAEGPGADEATSATAVDRYTGDCRILELAYSTGTQGDFEHLPPFEVKQGDIVDAWEGNPWPPSDGGLGQGDINPYPGRDEIVVVRNSKVGPDLEAIRCVA